ncbi:hypothetical protein PANDA_006793, partial [Ailuropoda melanoleuca]
MRKALKKSKTQPTIKCQQGYGICRERCRHDETETHFCRNKGKCCIPTKSTALTNVIVNEVVQSKTFATTMPYY